MKLVELMPRPVAAIIAAKGEITKYQTFNELDLVVDLIINNGFRDIVSVKEDLWNS